jgi:hypothetical protein
MEDIIQSLDTLDISIVNICTEDNVSYNIRVDYMLKCCKLFQCLPTIEETIRMNVGSFEFKHILDFINHYKGDMPEVKFEKPLKIRNIKEVVDEYSYNFLIRFSYGDNIEFFEYVRLREDIYKVIEACNYLGFDYLYNICTVYIASLVKGIPILYVNKVLKEDKMILKK